MSTDNWDAPQEMPREALETEVNALRTRVDELETELRDRVTALEQETKRMDALSTQLENLKQIVLENPDDAHKWDDHDNPPLETQIKNCAQDEDLSAEASRLNKDHSKLARRLSVVEDDIGIAAVDSLATTDTGPDAHSLTKLERLIRHGPEAVTNRPSPTHYRAKVLVENWNRWGLVRKDAHGHQRRLASRRHDLKTRLEDERGERLEWKQVYRAMQLVEDWSEGVVRLKEGSSDEGKYVLVHNVEEET